MIQDKHTPGPWRIKHDHGSMHLKAADNTSLMCDETYYPWVPDNLSDWHLIAAAPDMLEASPRAVLMMRIASELIRDGLAVDQTVFYDDAECDGYCVADDLDFAAEALDAAIARATGADT